MAIERVAYEPGDVELELEPFDPDLVPDGEDDEDEEKDLHDIPAGGKQPRRRRGVTWNGIGLGRQPTKFEAQVLDIPTMVLRFREELESATEVLLTIRREALRAPGGLPEEFGTRQALEDLQTRLARFGASCVRGEAARQGVTIHLRTPPNEHPVLNLTEDQASSLSEAAARTAAHLDGLWRDSIAWATARLRRAKRDRMTPEDVVKLASKREAWGLKAAVRGIEQTAFVFGRQSEMRALKVRRRPELAPGEVVVLDDEPPDEDEATAAEVAEDVAEVESLVDYVIQSAILDKHTCSPCESADGKIFPLGSEEQLEYEPPYYDCDGSDFCRCLQIAVIGNWRDREDVEDALASDRILVKTEKQAERMIEKRQGPNRYTED